MSAYLNQYNEEIKVGNEHNVGWIVEWDWPPNINMNTAGMLNQLLLKYWYTKPGQPDTTKMTITLEVASFNGTMIDRTYPGLWEGVPWQQGQVPPPPEPGWTMNLKYTIASVLSWYEGLKREELKDSWNSGVYLHAM